MRDVRYQAPPRIWRYVRAVNGGAWGRGYGTIRNWKRRVSPASLASSGSIRTCLPSLQTSSCCLASWVDRNQHLRKLLRGSVVGRRTCRNTTALANADALSRLSVPVEPSVACMPLELVLLTDHLSNSPVTAQQICDATRKDPQLIARLAKFHFESKFTHKVFDNKTELSLYEGCLLWGTRVSVLPRHTKAYRADMPSIWKAHQLIRLLHYTIILTHTRHD